MIYMCCVGFAWNHGLYQLSDEYLYVYCVEGFAHIECYSDYLMCVVLSC